MEYTRHPMENQFVVNLSSGKMFYIEGLYKSDDHLTAVLIDDDDHPNLINWSEHSSEYVIHVA